MIEELTPEIIWIAGLGAVVVFGLMMAVWYVSVREGGDKIEPTNINSTSTPAFLMKSSKKKRQYGSPRKKKDVGVSENESPDVVTETETISIVKNNEDPPSLTQLGDHDGDDVKPVEQPSRRVLPEQEKLRSSKGTAKVRTQEVKGMTSTEQLSTERLSTERPLTKQPLSERPSTEQPLAERPLTDRTVAKKTKVKVKQQQPISDEIPSSQIIQAVTNSTLSEEEVQIIMEKLLEKQDEEWEATGKGDNIKSLKKANEELVARCHDAEKSAQLHSQRVKEIGSELKQERSRLMNSEKAFQIKSGKQQEDIDNLKKKVQQYKEEVEMLKGAATSTPSPSEISRLEENNQAIRSQLSQLASEKSKVTNQLKELHDTNKQLTQKLTKETEKVGALQIDKKNINGELLLSREEAKKLEHELSELQRKAQSLQSQLAVTEEKLSREKKVNSSNDEEEREKVQLLNTLKQEHAVAMKQLQEKHVLELNEIKSQTQIQLDEMKADMSYLEANKNDKMAQVDDLHKENTALKEELEVVKSEVQKLTETVEHTKVNGQLEIVKENPLSSSNSVSEEELSELKKQNAALQDKVNDLKTKNNELRDKSWKARDEQELTVKECNDKIKATEREHMRQVRQLKETASVNEEHLQQMMFLKTYFPTLLDVKDKEFNEWVAHAQECISEKLKEMEEDCENKKKKIDEMTKEVEEGSHLTNELRDTLSDTLAKLEDLMKKWEEKEKGYNETIHKEELERDRIEEDSKDTREKLEKLTTEYNTCKLQCEALEKERDNLARQNEETLSTSKKHLETLEDEKALRENATREKEQVEQRWKQVEEQVSRLTAENETLTQNLTQLNADIGEYKTKLQESESRAESLRSANQDLNHRLQVKFSPPPTASTSSDV